MSLYPKIESPFERYTSGHLRNKMIPGQWTREEFAILADASWAWTEKVDGTNVRVMWDGYTVSFGGRTDNAQMPMKLIEHLQATFTEELMEQRFQDKKVVLYGEGVGAGIQNGGGVFGDDASFILFDVSINGVWLPRVTAVADVAVDLGIPVCPIVGVGSVQLAVSIVTAGLKSHFGEFQAEGLVGQAPMGLLDRRGKPLMMKVKSVDFFHGGN